MSPDPTLEALRELARSYGIQVDYVDTSGRVQEATAPALLAVLRALGAEIGGVDDAGAALVARRLATWSRPIEPVLVAWDGVVASVEVRMPADRPPGPVACRLVLEGGEARDWSAPIEAMAPAATFEAAGRRFESRLLALPGSLPWGYHRLAVDLGGGTAAEALVISAPTRCFAGPEGTGKRPWGVFCPMHALHGPDSWGAGDHSDLEALMDWTRSLGGGLVATLPMLAATFDGPAPIISPYSPTTRLFWNEFYLDLRRVAGVEGSTAAKALIDSPETAAEIESLRADPFVKYGRQMRLKRAVLEILAAEFFDGGGREDAGYREFLAASPDVEAYARFQALGEVHGRNFRGWPADAEPEPAKVRYHLFAQWQADVQLGALAAKAKRDAMTWYLDFPVGVDFNSFDVYRDPDSFAVGASVGCPPDLVFTKGQNWGFPPLHPDRQREAGYRYLIASFRNHFRYASGLRIDHVMGLHRLYWIPDGADASRGAFVSYPAGEIYAILSVESHRRGAWVVGEDLGTVPPEVATALDRHEVRGMYVVQYEMRPDPDRPLRPVPAATVASINTHDMPPFAAYWGGIDLADRVDLGLLNDQTLAAETEARQAQRSALVGYLRAKGFLEGPVDDAGAVIAAIWGWLAASPSRVMLINLEDLWLETESQNTPNTYDERPNWSRKLARRSDAFAADPAYAALLGRVDRARSAATATDALAAAPGATVEPPTLAEPPGIGPS